MPNEGLPDEPNQKAHGLIRLEKQIIALTVNGYSSEEIAKRIGVSAATIQRHLTNICVKLCVSNQFELTLFALYYQLIDGIDASLPESE